MCVRVRISCRNFSNYKFCHLVSLYGNWAPPFLGLVPSMKPISLFYLVAMRMEVKDPTRGLYVKHAVDSRSGGLCF